MARFAVGLREVEPLFGTWDPRLLGLKCPMAPSPPRKNTLFPTNRVMTLGKLEQ